MHFKLIILLCFFLCSISIQANEDLIKGEKAYNKRFYKKAELYFLKAAMQGEPLAQEYLGNFYKKNTNGKQDIEISNEWYSKAYQGYLKAAYQGDPYAISSIAKLYEKGNGVKRNKSLANAWYQRAAIRYIAASKSGDGKASYMLGNMYKSGDGVVKDIKKANSLYILSAEQGYARSQVLVGFMYEFGQSSVPKDGQKAVYWFEKSAEQGDSYSQNHLGNIYRQGILVKADYQKAIYWYNKSGDKEAFYMLGTMYEEGQGVEVDYDKAIKYYYNAINYYKINSEHSKFEGYPAAEKRKTGLISMLKCENAIKNPTLLFGSILKCANRYSLRVAVKSSGADFVSKSIYDKTDKYSTSKILEGSRFLEISFKKNMQFAQAIYNFPSSMDAGQITKVLEFVSQKYGEPTYSKGHPALGEVAYIWKMEDTIELKVYRGWPDTTTYLSFTDIDNYAEMILEDEAKLKKRRAKKYEAQSNAF